MPANLCIVVGCATKRARGYRDRRGKGGQLDVVCGTGLYRLGGTFLGLNQVRRVAGESDEDREVRLQALRTKDPGSVPLELVVSVLVTVVSFTLTCFSISRYATGTEVHCAYTNLFAGDSAYTPLHKLFIVTFPRLLPRHSAVPGSQT